MNTSQKQALAIGAGVAVLAGAAIGTYFLTGKHAKNRKKLAAWAGKMKDEIVRQLKMAGDVSREKYHHIVDTVAQDYQALKHMEIDELSATAHEMKKHWDVIQSELKEVAGTVRRVKANGAARAAGVEARGRRAPALKGPARKTARRPARKMSAR